MLVIVAIMAQRRLSIDVLVSQFLMWYQYSATIVSIEGSILIFQELLTFPLEQVNLFIQHTFYFLEETFTNKDLGENDNRTC